MAAMAVVEIIRVELTALDPGVTDAGEKAQTAPAGILEQESATALRTDPDIGVTVTIAVAGVATPTFRLDGAAPKLMLPAFPVGDPGGPGCVGGGADTE